MARPTQLWMGDVEPYMTESFLINSFQKMGEKPVLVKIIRNKFSGEPAGYCFVHFTTEEEALAVSHKLNGKVIPNTSPPVRFRLRSGNSAGKSVLMVSELSSDVDDYMLYAAFASYYQIRLAKVVLDNYTGLSKGFGFIKFISEDEQKHCINHMNGFKGLGSKPIKISNIKPEARTLATLNMAGGYSLSGQDYTSGYEQIYWQNYLTWQNLFDVSVHSNFFNELAANTILDSTIVQKEDELELIEHDTKLDVDTWNREMIQRDFNLWDALECSKWTPHEPLDDPSQPARNQWND